MSLYIDKETVLHNIPDNEMWRLTDHHDLYDIINILSKLLELNAEACLEHYKSLDQVRIGLNYRGQYIEAAMMLENVGVDILNIIKETYGDDHSVYKL